MADWLTKGVHQLVSGCGLRLQVMAGEGDVIELKRTLEQNASTGFIYENGAAAQVEHPLGTHLVRVPVIKERYNCILT